jgi:hypothetical protein
MTLKCLQKVHFFEEEEEEELYFCMLERRSFDKMAGETQNGES